MPTYRLADVPAALRLVGDLAGTRATAEPVAQRFEAEVQRLRQQHAGGKVLRVMVQIDDRPLFTVNGRHVISEIVELCGGRNVFAELAQIAPQVDEEAVLARDPEVILGADGSVDALRAQWQRWPRLTAVRKGTIYALPADVVARASPRLPQGAAGRVCRAGRRAATTAVGGTARRLSAAGAARAPRCRARGVPARARPRTAGRTAGSGTAAPRVRPARRGRVPRRAARRAAQPCARGGRPRRRGRPLAG